MESVLIKMRKISKKNKQIINENPYYRRCARENYDCDGRITIEHALIFAGKQIDEIWNFVPLCEYHHAVNRHQDGGDLKKEINVWIALNQAEESDLRRYSKSVDYVRMREVLNKKYGVYKV